MRYNGTGCNHSVISNLHVACYAYICTNKAIVAHFDTANFFIKSDSASIANIVKSIVREEANI